MTYYMATTIAGSFEDAIRRTEVALSNEGFGIVSRIDIEKILKEKIDADFRPYVILGACNPSLALKALQLEDKVGTMLPCNVIVQQSDDRGIEVAAIDPVASMQAIDNPELKDAAKVVRDKLTRVIGAVAKG